MSGDRQPAVAGQFYPADEAALREKLEWAFAHELGPGGPPRPDPGNPDTYGVVAPHAGLSYSGPVAAHAYAALAEAGTPDVVIALGPNHTGRGKAVSVSEAERWRTPLGAVEIHEEARSVLLDRSAVATAGSVAHASEHAVEVHLPFLQYLYDDPPAVLPIAVGRQDDAVVADLGPAIAATIEDVDAAGVTVASTDLTHYEPRDVAQRKDEMVIDRIEALDASGLLDLVESESISMCGYGPTAAVIHAVADVGATTGRRLEYATSGDLGGDPSSVVGYCAAAFE
ncbi:MAG: AmmeMemoRadiSam system protein B [Halanaeroarchaeum sp.]